MLADGTVSREGSRGSDRVKDALFERPSTIFSLKIFEVNAYIIC
ncbi:MAG: hypothetical protein QW291_00170 [Thermofilaceae archaeon]